MKQKSRDGAYVWSERPLPVGSVIRWSGGVGGGLYKIVGYHKDSVIIDLLEGSCGNYSERRGTFVLSEPNYFSLAL